MSKQSSHTKATEALFEKIKGLQDAIEARYAPQSQLWVDGRASSQPDTISGLEAHGVLQSNVVAARAALKKALDDREAGIAAAKRYYNTVVAAIVADKGDGSSELPMFGIVPRKAPRPLTSDQKVIAVARRNATRKARGIMGRKQREAIGLAGQAGVIAVTPSGTHVPVRPNVPAAGDGGLLGDSPTSSSTGTANAPASAPANARPPDPTGSGSPSPGSLSR